MSPRRKQVADTVNVLPFVPRERRKLQQARPPTPPPLISKEDICAQYLIAMVDMVIDRLFEDRN